MDGAGIGPEIRGDGFEQRRLARAVRPDDQAALSRRHFERNVVRGRQPAEGLAQTAQLERGAHFATQRVHNRRTPGTMPSGMKMTISTKTKPSSMFQRSRYAET